tara:strand:+ start:1662 stop:1814 length:153 start_codon:yes stop_codon:yes gene_type:complete
VISGIKTDRPLNKARALQKDIFYLFIRKNIPVRGCFSIISENLSLAVFAV